MSENQDCIMVKRTVNLKDGFASVEYRHFIDKGVNPDEGFAFAKDKVIRWIAGFGETTQGGIKSFNDRPKPPSDDEKKIASISWRENKYGEYCFGSDFEKAGLEGILMQFEDKKSLTIGEYTYRRSYGDKDGVVFINRKEKKRK